MSRFEPVRTCCGCGRKTGKEDLIRIVRTPEGNVQKDPGGNLNGRGVYLCRNADCLKKAWKRKGLDRGLRTPVPQEILEELQKEMDDLAAE